METSAHISGSDPWRVQSMDPWAQACSHHSKENITSTATIGNEKPAGANGSDPWHLAAGADPWAQSCTQTSKMTLPAKAGEPVCSNLEHEDPWHAGGASDPWVTNGKSTTSTAMRLRADEQPLCQNRHQNKAIAQGGTDYVGGFGGMSAKRSRAAKQGRFTARERNIHDSAPDNLRTRFAQLQEDYKLLRDENSALRDENSALRAQLKRFNPTAALSVPLVEFPPADRRWQHFAESEWGLHSIAGYLEKVSGWTLFWALFLIIFLLGAARAQLGRGAVMSVLSAIILLFGIYQTVDSGILFRITEDPSTRSAVWGMIFLATMVVWAYRF